MNNIWTRLLPTSNFLVCCCQNKGAITFIHSLIDEIVNSQAFACLFNDDNRLQSKSSNESFYLSKCRSLGTMADKHSGTAHLYPAFSKNFFYSMFFQLL